MTPRLHVAEALVAGRRIALAPRAAHYLLRVMRRRPGDGVLVFNGRDGEWRGAIDEAGRRGCAVVLTERTRAQAPEDGPWLVLAPVKRHALDLIARAATELGVTRFVPVRTRNTVTVRIALPRLAAIAIEAAEQCNRLTVPEWREPAELDAVLADWPSERRLFFCDEAGGGTPIAAALAGDGPWAVLIGPEGGFAEGERAALRDHPAVIPVSLGPRILRTETAAIAALACGQTLAGNWRGPQRR